MEFLSVRQTADKWHISNRRIQTLCAEGRISGATKVDSTWIIPADAEKPVDARIKSGRYVKTSLKEKKNGQAYSRTTS